MDRTGLHRDLIRIRELEIAPWVGLNHALQLEDIFELHLAGLIRPIVRTNSCELLGFDVVAGCSGQNGVTLDDLDIIDVPICANEQLENYITLQLSLQTQ